ncbi:Casparian strip membrane protein 1 [Heracleum sosnowskyi]|uniref:CASP-like protein n=1 Tax=Heracleum sosnowskyi TaxID=360622 RepID=A0AAD8HZQ0_9APIA|nr:Casparian strip membrane protein 1 [Heracleum sosnowskyi]
MMKASKYEAVEAAPPLRNNRGISILDLIFRVIALGATLGSSVAMATSEQELPFFTRFLKFDAQYDDFPTFAYFVLVNAIVCGYFALSIPLSILTIARSRAEKSRIILIIMDLVMLGLLTSAASATTSILYLAHTGSGSANWLAVCQQFNDFCHQASGSLIGSFGAVVILMLLIIIQGTALSRQH